MKYTDPSGYTWFSDWGEKLGETGRMVVTGAVCLGIGIGVATLCAATGGLGAVAIAVIAGASSGGIGGMLNTAFAGGGFEDYLINGTIGLVVGAASGLAGYGAGKFATDLAFKGIATIGSQSPVLSGAITGGFGGSIGGGAGGYTGGFIEGLCRFGNLEDAHQNGIKGAKTGFVMGLAIGTATGAYGGYKNAKDNGRSPWSGKKVETKNDFFNEAEYSPKVKDQMSNKADNRHGFPESVDGFAAEYGKQTTKTGGDGKSFQWLEIDGSYGKNTGTFEYIKGADGVINHRYFNINKKP